MGNIGEGSQFVAGRFFPTTCSGFIHAMRRLSTSYILHWMVREKYEAILRPPARNSPRVPVADDTQEPDAGYPPRLKKIPLAARGESTIGCAHGSCEARSRREEEAMSMYIVDDQQRRDRPQSPCALRVPASRGHLPCWYSSTMCTDIACVAPHCICPRGARNAAHCTFNAGC